MSGRDRCLSYSKVAKLKEEQAHGVYSQPSSTGNLTERPGLNRWSVTADLKVSAVVISYFWIFRFALSAMDMEQRDYDSRTALHVAAAEGNVWTTYSFYRLKVYSRLKAFFCCCCFGEYRSCWSCQVFAGGLQSEPFPQGQVSVSCHFP